MRDRSSPVDLRLAVPAAVGWVAAGVLVGLPGAAPWAAAALWMLAVGVLVIRRPGVIALCLIVAALVCTLIGVRAESRAPIDAGRLTDVPLVITGAVEGMIDGAPVHVFGDLNAPIGATVLISGTASAASPGEHTAFLIYPTRTRLVAPAPWFLDWATGLRSRFMDAAADLPGDGAALLPGLAIGDTRAVGNELDAAMKASSLSHLTAVSGSNCAIVVGLVVLLGQWLGLSRTARVCVALVFLAAFVVLVTPEPSVVRAAVMAAIVLGAMASGRPVRGVPVLGLAVIVLLVGDPWLARDYGFALSVLATGGLLLLARPVARVLGRWMPLPLATVIAVPLAAQVCCQPVLILLEPSLPTYGVVANVLAEPAAPAATVVGLLACIALPVAPWLGQLLAAIAWLPASWIAAVATFFAALPFGSVPWPAEAGGALLLAVVTALGIAGLRFRWARIAASIALVVMIGVVAGTRLGVLVDRPTDWQYAMCDVGQGDATLVRSADRIALIDTGPDPEPLSACLGDLGIHHLDLLVLTHFDADHVGGVPAVLGIADRVLVGPTGGPEHERIVRSLADSGADVTVAERGLVGVLGQFRWEVLWPKPAASPGNDASIVMAFLPGTDCACVSAITLGDLGEEAQARVVASGVPAVDLVKVAHHGSADQAPRLYEAIRASIALIGVGADNTYGHPTDSLLATLEATGTAVFRTDLDGLILVSPGPTVWTARVAPHG